MIFLCQELSHTTRNMLTRLRRGKSRTSLCNMIERCWLPTPEDVSRRSLAVLELVPAIRSLTVKMSVDEEILLYIFPRSLPSFLMTWFLLATDDFKNNQKTEIKIHILGRINFNVNIWTPYFALLCIICTYVYVILHTFTYACSNEVGWNTPRYDINWRNEIFI